MKKNNLVLNLVIPCYNEEEALPLTKKELDKKMSSLIEEGLISENSKVVLVNDGSKDKSVPIIESYVEKDSRIRLYKNESLSADQYSTRSSLYQ